MAGPLMPAEYPVRWNTGGAVWSTSMDDFATFLETGDIEDRALLSGLNNSGWSHEEVRSGLSKTYDVDLIGVSRFLYSDEGVKFLKNQTTSYFPYWAMTDTSVVALRSAIIADAADGSISSAGIMSNLPVNFRLADTCGTYTGAQNVCAEGQCSGDAQCTSLLSWYVFLPACIQANQVAMAEPAPRPAPAPAPAPMPIRGLW
ncbi:alpha/beta hydrolase [Synechococcus sp. RSCCF101]|nr:alpha/beta hydrolase [Synechococcus sp. RSCCF101]